MSYTITRVKGPGVVVTLNGTLNNTEMAAMDKELLSLAVKEQDMAFFLIDTTNLAANNVSTSQIRDSAVTARETGLELDLQAEIIFVMPADLDYGIARVWNGFFATEDKKVHIYRNRNDAQDFIDQLISDRH